MLLSELPQVTPCSQCHTCKNLQLGEHASLQAPSSAAVCCAAGASVGFCQP